MIHYAGPEGCSAADPTRTATVNQDQIECPQCIAAVALAHFRALMAPGAMECVDCLRVIGPDEAWYPLASTPKIRALCKSCAAARPDRSELPGYPAGAFEARPAGSLGKLYVASGRENADTVFWFAKKLQTMGFEWTYDWTERVMSGGPASPDELARIGLDELDAVCRADFVLVILPGGAGTHTELGAALALGKRVVLLSWLPLPECPFYRHPAITVVSSYELAAARLLQEATNPRRGREQAPHIYVSEAFSSLEVANPPGAGADVTVHALGTQMRLRPGEHAVLARDLRATATRIALMLSRAEPPAGAPEAT